MLYETAARSAELLALNVEDLDLVNRRARVRRKGGAVDIIVWQTATARLLPRLLKGRRTGPVFVTERRARVPLHPADLDPSGRARLSYQQAEALFTGASGGATLHQLRHSALSHDAEDGTGTPMLMARSGHTSVWSLAKYARVSAEALERHQAPATPVATAVARPPNGGLGESMTLAEVLGNAEGGDVMGERDKEGRAARAERLPGLQQRYPGWSIRFGPNGWYAKPRRTGGLFREIHASHAAELAVMMRGQDVLRTRLSHAVAGRPAP